MLLSQRSVADCTAVTLHSAHITNIILMTLLLATTAWCELTPCVCNTGERWRISEQSERAQLYSEHSEH
jgi:hypothetical protein